MHKSAQYGQGNAQIKIHLLMWTNIIDTFRTDIWTVIVFY